MKSAIIYSIVIILLFAVAICIISVIRFNDKSQADKYFTIISGALSVAIAVLGIVGMNTVEFSINDSNDFVVNNNNQGTINIVTEENTLSEEKQLLLEAKTSFDLGHYESTLSILQSEELINNPVAKMNTGYLYAHGYGVEQNVDTALKLYGETDSLQSKKNTLAVLIATNSEGRNNELVETLLSELLSSEDDDVREYIALCQGNATKKTPTEIDMEIFYQYEYVDTRAYSNPPRDTGFCIYKFKGADYPDGWNGLLPITYYEQYRLKNIDTIEGFATS